MIDSIGDKIDNIPGVVNNLSSTSETDALSAAMWKELQDQINAMSWNYHFLSSWDCTTGLPWSDPAADPYTYTAWDYYIVSTVASGGGTNYKPHWASYTHGVASTAVETGTVDVNDWYIYDGATWILQPSGWVQITVDTALSDTSTNPVENRVITQALNNKQNTISNLATIEAGAAAWATALQPNDNITALVNNAGYQTAGDVASAISGKQDTMSAGDGISITSNTITNTKPWPTISSTAPSNPTEGMLWYDSTEDVLKVYDWSWWMSVWSWNCITWWTDINVVSWAAWHNLPTGYTEIEYIYSAWWSWDKPYIDTGITIWSWQTYSNTDITLEYIATLLSNGWYCVSWTAFASWIWIWIYGTNDNPSYWIWSSAQTGTGTVSGQKLRWYINWTNGQVKIENMNWISLFSITAATSTITTNTKILVGSYSGNTNPPSSGSTAYNKMKWYMYEFKVYGWSTLIRHGIPAIQDSNNEVWLYDIVWNQFYGSANSWTWTAWPEIVNCDVINFTWTNKYLQKSNYRLIKATTSTPFNTRDKICTTAEGNYVPQEWDVLSVVFTNWCWVGSPRLDIDNSWLHSIVISSTGWANAATLWLGMSKIAWTFVYDWTNRVTWPIKDTIYSAGSGISISSSTITNTLPWPTVSWTAPASPSEWAMWYDSTNDVLKVYDGTNRQEVGSWGWSTCLVWGTDISVGPVSELPEWYTELQWIGVGSSALTLNYSWLNKKIVFDAMSTQTSWQTAVQIIASYDSDYLGCFWWTYNRNWAVQTDTGNTGISADTRATVTFTFDSWNNSYNRATVATWWVTKTWTRSTVRTGGDLNLFWAVENNTLITQSTFKGNIYSVKIYDNTTNALLTDLVPCKDPSNAVWMYDLVWGTFYPASKWTFTAWDVVDASCTKISFTNTSWYIKRSELVAWNGISIEAGTAARLPSGYTELEYVESTGSEGIDTGITFANVTKTEIVWNFTENVWWFRSVLWADNQNASATLWKYAVCMWEWSNWKYYTECALYAGQWTAPSWWVDYVYSSAPVDTNEHTFTTTFTWGQITLAVDNYTDVIPSATKQTWCTIWLWLFSRHLQSTNGWWGWAKFRLKSVIIYNWNSIIFNWVPAKRNSDDEIWVYDLVTNTFLTNDTWNWWLVWGNAVVFDPTTTISSTVLDFTNLTYDSLASDTWSATSSVAFPSTAKVAFITWRAIKWSVIYASWETIFPRTNWFIKSSFIWWWASSSEFVSWWIMYDYQTWNIVYTRTDWAWSVVIDYAIYFYK